MGGPLDSGRPLIIHMDADLYSSTLFVLTYLSDYLPGANVIFDEFDSAFDEFRALEDYCSAYRRSYEVLAVTDWCEHVAIRFDRAEIAASANDGRDGRQRLNAVRRAGTAAPSRRPARAALRYQS